MLFLTENLCNLNATLKLHLIVRDKRADEYSLSLYEQIL